MHMVRLNINDKNSLSNLYGKSCQAPYYK